MLRLHILTRRRSDHPPLRTVCASQSEIGTPATEQVVRTCADLKAKPLSFLQQNFGRSGSWCYQIARGIDERPVESDRPRKSVGAEDTFADIFELGAARAELLPLAAKVWRYCEAHGIRGRTLTLKVKYADFQQITRSQTATSPPERGGEIEAICFALLEQIFPFSKGIRLLRVTLSSLVEESDVGGGPVSAGDLGPGYGPSASVPPPWHGLAPAEQRLSERSRSAPAASEPGAASSRGDSVLIISVILLYG